MKISREKSLFPVPVAFIGELCYHGARILDLVLYKANIANSDNSARKRHAHTHDTRRSQATMYKKKPRSLTLVLDSFVPSARVMDREKITEILSIYVTRI